MLTFRKLIRAAALALGAALLVATLAAPQTAQAQYFDKPGFGGGFGYAPPPFFVRPPVFYAPPPRFYHPPPPPVFYVPPPRFHYGPRPYYGRPHGHRRHW